MTTQIVALAGPRDALSSVGKRDIVRIRFDAPGHPHAPTVKVAETFARNNVKPSATALDLLRLAVSVYVADTRVLRDDAFDGWTRDLALHAFVQDLKLWRDTAPLIGDLLSFLTGDHWRLNFRQTPNAYRPVAASPGRNPQHVVADRVSLLSGGLDSFVGALDLLEAGHRVAFVGHQTGGGGATSRAQNEVARLLEAAYGIDRVPYLRLFVSPPPLNGRRSEPSTRSRSLLFIALALATASGIGATRLVVPENGFISLNVPLTPSRLGSLSTRTTHPHFITLFNSLLSNLGLGTTLALPYRFATKGELLGACKNMNVLRHGMPHTVSCSHTEAGRYHGNPNLQCGRCVPCVVRRAAIAVLGADPTPYGHQDLSVAPAKGAGIDLRVLRFGLARFAAKAPTLADVLVPGPLKVSADDLQHYLGVFDRGLAELRALLRP
jgi:7-cyano-7-deazaguanine synthase in queuosine biosynthesis